MDLEEQYQKLFSDYYKTEKKKATRAGVFSIITMIVGSILVAGVGPILGLILWAVINIVCVYFLGLIAPKKPGNEYREFLNENVVFSVTKEVYPDGEVEVIHGLEDGTSFNPAVIHSFDVPGNIDESHSILWKTIWGECEVKYSGIRAYQSDDDGIEENYLFALAVPGKSENVEYIRNMSVFREEPKKYFVKKKKKKEKKKGNKEAENSLNEVPNLVAPLDNGENVPAATERPIICESFGKEKELLPVELEDYLRKLFAVMEPLGYKKVAAVYLKNTAYFFAVEDATTGKARMSLYHHREKNTLEEIKGLLKEDLLESSVYLDIIKEMVEKKIL